MTHISQLQCDFNNRYGLRLLPRVVTGGFHHRQMQEIFVQSVELPSKFRRKFHLGQDLWLQHWTGIADPIGQSLRLGHLHFPLIRLGQGFDARLPVPWEVEQFNNERREDHLAPVPSVQNHTEARGEIVLPQRVFARAGVQSFRSFRSQAVVNF